MNEEVVVTVKIVKADERGVVFTLQGHNNVALGGTCKVGDMIEVTKSDLKTLNGNRD